MGVSALAVAGTCYWKESAVHWRKNAQLCHFPWTVGLGSGVIGAVAIASAALHHRWVIGITVRVLRH